MLKSKIHRARLTGAELDYEGSITIDQDLLDEAEMLDGEQVHVLNMNTGSRLVTYIIAGERGTGQVMLNGPAARLGQVGDEVIAITFVHMDAESARRHTPKVVFVDERNRPRNPKRR